MRLLHFVAIRHPQGWISDHHSALPLSAGSSNLTTRCMVAISHVDRTERRYVCPRQQEPHIRFLARALVGYMRCSAACMHRLTNRIAVSPLTGDVSCRSCTSSCIFEVLVLADSAASDAISIAITTTADACILCQADVWCMRDTRSCGTSSQGAYIQ